MPKTPAGKKAKQKSSIPLSVEVPTQPQEPETSSAPASTPPVSTRPPIAEPAEIPAEETNLDDRRSSGNIWNQPAPAQEAVDWSKGRTEIWRLDNGAVLTAKTETASDVYKNKGATLVDVIFDKDEE